MLKYLCQKISKSPPPWKTFIVNVAIHFVASLFGCLVYLPGIYWHI